VKRDLASPPRVPERLLAAALIESELRECVLGDLHEEYVTRAKRSSGLGLRAWYWCEALRLAARFSLRRLCRRSHLTHRTRSIVGDIKQETVMSSVGADVKYAVRAIRKRPGASLVVAFTLALGLGVNATVLGMMDALLLRPFQFRDYPRLVVLWETVRGASEREAVAPANFFDWQAHAQSVEQLAAWAWLDATLSGRGEPERVQGFRVSSGFFELLGIVPSLGRTFTRDDERLGSHRRVVLGDGLWKRRFGADPAIVGTDIIVDGEAFTVVGVAPLRFAFPVGSELWVPLAFTPARANDREDRSLTVAGRLASGRSLDDAQAEMDVIGRALSQQYPRTNSDRGVAVRSLSTAFREGSTVPFVGILQVAAGLVLLVACANVAGLLLARAVDRQRELALRTALGAARTRIVRQLVTETMVLGLFSSVLALLLARVGLDALRASIPAETARFVEGWDNLRLDGRLVAAVPALAIGVGLLIGLVPAIAATRTDVTDALREGDRGAIGGVRRQRGRQALVVAEIALALSVLIAAGLTLAGGVRLVNQPGGFDSRGLLTLQIPLPDSKYREPGSSREFASALLAQLEAVPTVQHAALANILPASGWSPSMQFVVDHDPFPDPARRPRSGYRAVSPDYFDVMRIPILSGRRFSSIDRDGNQPVAMVSASLARRYWPDQDPVGRRLRLEGSENGWLHIVGVSGDVKMYNWWDGEDPLAVYVPIRQAPLQGLVYAAVRTHGDQNIVTGAVREAVRAVDPLLPVTHVRTMREAIGESSAGLTNLAMLMGICGGIGLVLSVVGIYSVMSYAVSQRTHEFGVRMALGASGRDLLRMTLREAGILTGLGLTLGCLMAIALGKLLGSALFGLVSLDATPFLALGLGLAIVSLAAACIPASRALKLDPATILRGQ
jgi:putative ABC transport system permease protein